MSDEKTDEMNIEEGSMKRFWSLLVLLILFFAFVTFFVYPRQEGALSSTQIEQDALAKVDSSYEETLPVQEVGGSQGRSIFIAFAMLSHVLFANLHLGGSWIAVITE